MNLKSYLSLGAASVAVLMGASAASAVTLAPGKLSFTTNEGVFFSNNVIDWTPDGVGGRTLGTPGDITLTSSPFDVSSGIFTDDPILPGDRTFLGTPAKINDLAFEKSVADALAGGGVQDGVEYDIAEFQIDDGMGGFFTQVSLLDFDTDEDGEFGESDDFQYFITSFERNTSGTDATGFDIRLDFNGFFRDNEGEYEDTPSVISFLNGATDRDPTVLPNIELADFVNPAFAGNGADAVNIDFISGPDGLITTELAAVPEPTAVLGLISVFGLAGGLLKRKRA